MNFDENVLHDRCMKPLPWTREVISKELHHSTKCPHCKGMLFATDTVTLTPFPDHVSLISITNEAILKMFISAYQDLSL